MYGIIVSTSILICLLLAERVAVRKHKDTDILWGASFFTIISGVIGARIYNVIDYWDYYSSNFINIFKVWHGGLGIIGGIVTGLVILVIYLKIKKQNIFEWLDIISLTIPLGQFLGRWANVWNKELLPYAYYEIIFNLALFAFLSFVYKLKKDKLNGIVVLLYLVCYGVFRFATNTLNP